jgi:exonuclease-1
MGIQGLLPIIKPLIRDCNVKDFSGKRVAVDGYCWLHRAVYNCCMELCNDQETDVWIKYFLGLVDLLLNAGIEVTLVFDGNNLPAKRDVEISRSTTRQSNIQKARLYQNSGDIKNARLYYSRATFATPRMAAILIRIMRQSHPMVKCIVAPYEADAQLSYLSINNLVDLVISEDSDNIPYGCSDIMFKLDHQGNCQRLVLSDLFTRVIPGFDLRTFSQEMIVTMCIASGCDYLVR